MRALPIAIALMLCSSPAMARTFVGKPSGSIEIDGVVEVPLYASQDREDPRYFVELKKGEQTFTMLVGTGEDRMMLTEAAVKRLGFKTKGDPDKIYVARHVRNIEIGTAKLSADFVLIGEPPMPGVDGVLPLGLFDDVSWAVLPSAGLLRVAPADKGGELASAIGTPAIPYTSSKWSRKKLTKGPKAEVNGASFIIPATFSGVEAPAFVAVEGSSMVLREGDWYKVRGVEMPKPIELPAAPTYKVGDSAVEWRDVGFAGQTHAVGVLRTGLGPVQAYLPAHAQIGADALAGVDFAIDSAAKTISLKPAAAAKLADYAPVKEAALRKKLDPVAKEGEDPPTDEQKKEARKGGLAPLATHLEAQGRYDEAIELRRESTQLDADTCTSWQALGNALLRSGHPADAIQPLTKAWELYQPWSKLPLADRQDLQEDYDAAKKKKEDWTGQFPQTHACATAAGQLALAKIASGDAAAVAGMYPELLDLDATLPVAAGTAALLDGDTQKAEAAFRQAAKLTVAADDTAARAGLWFALQRRDLGLAREQLERSNFLYGKVSDGELVRAYADGVRAKEGPAGAVKALESLIASQPQNVDLLLQLAREQTTAGDAPGAQKSRDRARAELVRAAAVIPNSLVVNAAWVELLLQEGKTDEARGHAETLAKLAPASGPTWLAMADVAAASGDAAKAGEYRRRAGIAWVRNPAYALLLK